MNNRVRINLPDASGHFGSYGGMFVPETLMTALQDLERAYQAARKELAGLLADFCGGPTALYFAERLTEKLGGAKIYLKHEDLLHTCAHKINNAIGQILLARRMGKPASSRRRARPARRRHRCGAIAHIIKVAPKMPKDAILIANLSGRGDKDVSQAAEILLKADPA